MQEKEIKGERSKNVGGESMEKRWEKAKRENGIQGVRHGNGECQSKNIIQT